MGLCYLCALISLFIVLSVNLVLEYDLHIHEGANEMKCLHLLLVDLHTHKAHVQTGYKKTF